MFLEQDHYILSQKFSVKKMKLIQIYLLFQLEMLDFQLQFD